MNALSLGQVKSALTILVVFHILVLTASNYLVQMPISIFGFHTTWGAFTFPFVFLATDLTVRIFGAAHARKIIYRVMIPALLISYAVSVAFYEGVFQGATALTEFNSFVARIAIASFAAYAVGQVLDIYVFNRLRQLRAWWIAPATSTLIGNLLDTIIFFSIAFYQSSDAFMAENWIEIASVDYAFKVVISLLMFLPLYGLLLRRLSTLITSTDKTTNDPQLSDSASLIRALKDN